ncbi:hypothetical protein TeGR_g13420, partial [Tetraparma gracilis]
MNGVPSLVPFSFGPRPSHPSALPAAASFCSSLSPETRGSCDSAVAHRLVELGAPIGPEGELPDRVQLARLLGYAGHGAKCVAIIEGVLHGLELSAVAVPAHDRALPARDLGGLMPIDLYTLLADCHRLSPEGLRIYESLHRRALAFHSSDPSSRFNIVHSVNYAVALSQIGDLEGSRAVFAETTGMLPTLSAYSEGAAAQPYADLAWLHLEAAQAEFENFEGRKDEALSLAEAALSILAPLPSGGSVDEHRLGGHLLVGKLILLGGEGWREGEEGGEEGGEGGEGGRGRAAEHLRTALALDPNNVEVISTLGHAEERRGGGGVSFATFASDPTRCEVQ